MATLVTGGLGGAAFLVTRGLGGALVSFAPDVDVAAYLARAGWSASIPPAAWTAEAQRAAWSGAPRKDQ